MERRSAVLPLDLAPPRLPLFPLSLFLPLSLRLPSVLFLFFSFSPHDFPTRAFTQAARPPDEGWVEVGSSALKIYLPLGADRYSVVIYKNRGEGGYCMTKRAGNRLSKRDIILGTR